MVQEEDSFVEVTCCPGCGSRDYAVASEVGASFETITGTHRFEQPEYEVRTCHQCGLYYKSNTLNAEQLGEYYDKVDFTKWDIGKLFPAERAILNILSRLPSGSRVLDYGCSDGRLLSHLGREYQKFGFEINETAAAIAKQKQIHVLSVAEMGAAEVLQFDAIVLSDMFEHLINPTEVLRNLKQRLTDDGLLILFTGNGDADACQRDIANFWYFRTPEHLCMIGKTHAEYLCRLLGLRLIEWTEMSHYDFLPSELARQRVQDFAYWQFRRNGSSLVTSLLRLTPMLRRAEHWQLPPTVTYTKDHVLAIFQNLKRLPGSSHAHPDDSF